jgi:hypothetical protein
MTALYAPDGMPYMISESDQGTQVGFPVNALLSTGINEVGYNQFPASQGEFAQMVTVPTSAGNLLLIRSMPNRVAELYSCSLDHTGSASLTRKDDEEWGADSLSPYPTTFHFGVLIQPVTLRDSTAGILVKSTAWLVYDPSGTSCLVRDTVDSPYVLRTLTQDKTGTEISWRGNLFPSNSTNQVALVPIATVNGNPEGGVDSNYGILTGIILNP